MKYSTLAIVSIALILLLTHCQKDKDFDPNIASIVMTDFNGVLIGSTDTDGDWEIGQTWAEEENALFDNSTLES